METHYSWTGPQPGDFRNRQTYKNILQLDKKRPILFCNQEFYKTSAFYYRPHYIKGHFITQIRKDIISE